MHASRIVLGTAQLGMNYGIANAAGRPSEGAAREIVRTAWDCGIRCYDTAQAYGASEAVLGDALSRCADSPPEVITKLAAGVDIDDVDAVISAVRGSVDRLRTKQLWGLMLHDEDALGAWATGRARGLDALKRSGLVRHLGVSVYSVERAFEAIGFNAADIVQVPANLFDRRMLRAGVFEKAAGCGKTVFVRSVFLQGLVFLEPDVAARVPRGRDASRALREFCAHNRLDVRMFAIDHVGFAAPESRILIGAETADQVTENCAAFAETPLPASLHAEWDRLWPDDHLDLLDPRSWPRQ